MERNILPNRKLNKELIKNRFARNAHTYRDYAVVQKQMAQTLIQNILDNTDLTYKSVMDFGCGDGTLTSLLLETLAPEKLIANDIATDFKPYIKKLAVKYPATDISFREGDIENMSIPDNIDLYTSNAVFQWLNSHNNFFMRLSEIMPNTSILAFSTFGINTLPEIKQITGHSLHYFSFDGYKEMLCQYFDITYAHEEIHTQYFNKPIDILRHLKKTGVNAVTQQHWNRNDLKNFSEKYLELFSCNGKVKLTYNPLYFIVIPKRNIL